MPQVHLLANDADAAEEVVFPLVEVHGAAQPFGGSLLLPKQLRKHLLRLPQRDEKTLGMQSKPQSIDKGLTSIISSKYTGDGLNIPYSYRIVLTRRDIKRSVLQSCSQTDCSAIHDIQQMTYNRACCESRNMHCSRLAGCK